MLTQRTLGIAAAVLVALGAAGVPTAVAAPATVKPGEPCNGSGPMETDSAWCDMQAGRWLSKGPNAVLGQHCDTVGDQRIEHGEYLAHCAQTAGGPVWKAGVHD